MEFYVDIADLETVKKVAEYYPIDGFTTNPNILTKMGSEIDGLMKRYKEYVEEAKCKIFIQVTAKTAEEMFAQAKELRDYFGEYLVIKLPAVKEGYKALKLCKAEGIAITITVVHSMMQALMAAKGGADYIAPYVTHIDDIGADGIRCVEEMVIAFENAGYPAKVLGASFRTVDQLEKLAVVGCQAVTITPEMFDKLIRHPSTDVSMAGFEKAWKDTFGEKQVTDLL